MIRASGVGCFCGGLPAFTLWFDIDLFGLVRDEIWV